MPHPVKTSKQQKTIQPRCGTSYFEASTTTWTAKPWLISGAGCSWISWPCHVLDTSQYKSNFGILYHSVFLFCIRCSKKQTMNHSFSVYLPNKLNLVLLPYISPSPKLHDVAVHQGFTTMFTFHGLPILKPSQSRAPEHHRHLVAWSGTRSIGPVSMD